MEKTQDNVESAEILMVWSENMIYWFAEDALGKTQVILDSLNIVNLN